MNYKMSIKNSDTLRIQYICMQNKALLTVLNKKAMNTCKQFAKNTFSAYAAVDMVTKHFITYAFQLAFSSK